MKFNVKVNSFPMAYGVAVLLSVFIFWLQWRTMTVINDDGILYLQGVKRYWDFGFSTAQQLYSWPFYSILIAWVSHFFTLEPEATALGLNLIFQIMITLSFMGIVQRLGGRPFILWLGMIVVLFFPVLHHFRVQIIRDFGFWGCYLGSIYSLMVYAQTRRWGYGIVWGMLVLLAGLFRVEGLVFLWTIPFVAWFLPAKGWRERLNIFCMLSSVGWALLGAIFIWLFTGSSHSVDQTGRFSQIPFALIHGADFTLNNLSLAISQMKQAVLSREARDAGWIILACGLVGYFLFMLGKTFGIIYIGLWGYGIKVRALILAKSELIIIIGLFLVNLLIDLYFTANFLFISERYVAALLFIPLLWVPFAIDRLWEYWQQRETKPRWIIPTLTLTLAIISVFQFMDLGYSKIYLQKSGQWLRTETPINSRIYTNVPPVFYYARGLTDEWPKGIDQRLMAIQDGSWNQYDYLAIRYPHADSLLQHEIETKINLLPFKIFANERGGRVIVYRTTPQP